MASCSSSTFKLYSLDAGNAGRKPHRACMPFRPDDDSYLQGEDARPSSLGPSKDKQINNLTLICLNLKKNYFYKKPFRWKVVQNQMLHL